MGEGCEHIAHLEAVRDDEASIRGFSGSCTGWPVLLYIFVYSAVPGRTGGAAALSVSTRCPVTLPRFTRSSSRVRPPRHSQAGSVSWLAYRAGCIPAAVVASSYH